MVKDLVRVILEHDGFIGPESRSKPGMVNISSSSLEAYVRVSLKKREATEAAHSTCIDRLQLYSENSNT